MPEIEIIAAMTRDAAQQLAHDIAYHLQQRQHHEDGMRSHEDQARRAIKAFKDAQAWTLLGYPSFAAAAQNEFGRCYQQAYRLVAAAEVDANLTEISGERYLVPVNHAKHLRKLPTPSQQQHAYDQAKSLASAEGGNVTEQHVERAVKSQQAHNFVGETQHKVVAHMVETGDVALKQAQRVVKEMDKLERYPQALAYLNDLIGRFGLGDEKLIPLIAERYLNRVRQAKSSRLLVELEQSGTLAGTPLADANTTDWDQAIYYAQQQAISEASAAQPTVADAAADDDPVGDGDDRPVPMPVVVTLYTHDPQRTLKALKWALSAKDLEILAKLLTEELAQAEVTA